METKHNFQNSKGDKLVGILAESMIGKNGSIIILVHGFSSNKNTKNFVKLTHILNEQNISTFRFDIYGHGESDGQFENITVSEAVDDILSAIVFLKEQGYVKIGLLGSSFGGIASIIVASKSKDLMLLTLKSPVSNFIELYSSTKSQKEIDDWKNRGYRSYDTGEGNKLKLNYTFYEDFSNNNGYAAAPSIQVPTLIVHGTRDQEVPVAQSIKIAKLIPNCTLALVEGANHRYEGIDHTQEMISNISEFIISHSI